MREPGQQTEILAEKSVLKKRTVENISEEDNSNKGNGKSTNHVNDKFARQIKRPRLETTILAAVQAVVFNSEVEEPDRQPNLFANAQTPNSVEDIDQQPDPPIEENKSKKRTLQEHLAADDDLDDNDGQPRIQINETSARQIKRPRLNINLPIIVRNSHGINIAPPIPVVIPSEQPKKTPDPSSANETESPKEKSRLHFKDLPPIFEASTGYDNTLILDGHTYRPGHPKGMFSNGWVRILNNGKFENLNGVNYISVRFILAFEPHPKAPFSKKGVLRQTIDRFVEEGLLFLGSNRGFRIKNCPYREYDLLVLRNTVALCI